MLYFILKSITKYDDYSLKVKVQKQQNIKLQYWHNVTPKKPTKKYDDYAIDKIINDQKLKREKISTQNTCDISIHLLKKTTKK